MRKKQLRKYYAVILTTGLALGLTACGSTETSESVTESATVAEKEAEEETEEAVDTATSDTASSEADDSLAGDYLSEEDITINDTIENTADGEHAILADGEEASYSNIKVVKTGEADGDEADFYGENASVFATNGATLNLSEMVVTSDGTHANGVFSYGEGTTVNVSDSVINTTGNCSGGIMTTGGGTMNATNLTIYTTGNSSAAIRSDRGGGTVNVEGGSYTTDGTGSPVIYSTADITVKNSYLESTASQGIVVEGKNSVTLENDEVIADNNTKNSDKSDYYQAVMIYQSMSGDAAEGTAEFSMKDTSLTNKNGDIFFVNNTVANITIENSEVVNEDASGVFLRAAAAGWGSEGTNGGNVNMYLKNQSLEGDMVVDSVSTLNLHLSDGSEYSGAINTDGQSGDIYVELDGDSTWTLTGDSYITSLTCDEDSINLNGYKLYINGEEYTEGTASEGTEVEAVTGSGSDHEMGEPGDGNGPGGDGGTPPAKSGEE